jgi:hypothetical protein
LAKAHRSIPTNKGITWLHSETPTSAIIEQAQIATRWENIMASIIAINGTRLDQVRMPLEPYGSGAVSFLSYPANQIQVSQNGKTLSLVVPAYLALELYRTGLLPQDVDTPVSVQVDGQREKEFLVTDVRYPHSNAGPFGSVRFTLTRVPKITPRPRSESQVALASGPAQQGAYVTDIRHYLDEHGEMASMPAPARSLASFLTLLIDEATSAFPAEIHDTGIRCRTKECTGTIKTNLTSKTDAISWCCLVCDHHGVIRNWQDTKWNRLPQGEPTD